MRHVRWGTYIGEKLCLQTDLPAACPKRMHGIFCRRNGRDVGPRVSFFPLGRAFQGGEGKNAASTEGGDKKLRNLLPLRETVASTNQTIMGS